MKFLRDVFTHLPTDFFFLSGVLILWLEGHMLVSRGQYWKAVTTVAGDGEGGSCLGVTSHCGRRRARGGEVGQRG